MANVSISPNLTDPQCVFVAQSLQQYWQTALTQMGSSGEFRIGHGRDGRCTRMHSAPWNGGLWIWSDPRGCEIFLSLKSGKPRDYAGAGRVPAGTYRGVGHCGCGAGH
jgi:hypothetical protein